MTGSAGTAVVTGASSGIGAATARQLARAGFEVVCAARRTSRIEELAAAIGGRAVRCDVTEPASVAELAAAVGPCAVLVNSAGGALGTERVDGADEDHWRTMWETNVGGVMRVTKALLPALRASGDGRIVVVGSVAGHEVYPGGGGYTAAKHAAAALVRTLRLELLGDPVRVTEVAPGMVETEFSLVRFGGDAERAAHVYDGLTPLSADDIADAIVWAVTRPPHVNIDRLDIKPVAQATAMVSHRGRLMAGGWFGTGLGGVGGRVVVVTGASAGIGRATALRLTRHGAVVVGAARDEGRLARLDGVEAVRCDVTDAADRQALIDGVLERHGRIDALVNNAGIGFEGLLEDMELADVEQLIATNCTAVVDLSRLALPAMLTAGSGDIVNISSVVAWVAAPPLGVYSASKYFVDGFTEALRREVWSRGVKVHSVNPGPTSSEFGLRARQIPVVAGSVPQQAGGVPAEWVAAAVERCLVRPWPRTAAVPRVLGAARAFGLVGVRTAVDVATTLPLGRRERPAAPR